MAKQRSAQWEAVRTRPFAYFYWGLSAVSIVLVVLAYGWGSTQHQILTGYFVISALIAQIITSGLVAARIERRRAEERERPPD